MQNLKNSKDVSNCFHLPQYVSFSFSPGKDRRLHTASFVILDFFGILQKRLPNGDRENIRALLPQSIRKNGFKKPKPELGGIPCGIVIHDSSAALLPTFRGNRTFILLSDGNLGY